MELEAVKKMLKESPTFAAGPGNYIMLYDINTWTHNQMRDLIGTLLTQFSMHVIMLGYDPHMGPEPIQLFKVSA